MSFWSAVSVGFSPVQDPTFLSAAVSCELILLDETGVSHLLSLFEDFFTYSGLGWTQDWKKMEAWEKRVGEETEAFLNLKKSLYVHIYKHIYMCLCTVCWSSRMYFVCTCVSPVLSLAQLIVTTERNTLSRQLAERGKAQAGALGLNQHPAWPLPPPLRVSWPSGCCASLSSVTAFSRNYDVEVKGLWKPQHCFMLIWIDWGIFRRRTISLATPQLILLLSLQYLYLP